MAFWINRNARNPTTTIANAATDSAAVKFGDYALGMFFIPSAFTGTSVSFKCSSAVDGTFSPLRDGGGSLISIPVAVSNWYPLPDELAGAAYFKIVSGSAEGAARTITLSVKG